MRAIIGVNPIRDVVRFVQGQISLNESHIGVNSIRDEVLAGQSKNFRSVF